MIKARVTRVEMIESEPPLVYLFPYEEYQDISTLRVRWNAEAPPQVGTLVDIIITAQ